jgi:hypothetical protein
MDPGHPTSPYFLLIACFPFSITPFRIASPLIYPNPSIWPMKQGFFFPSSKSIKGYKTCSTNVASKFHLKTVMKENIRQAAALAGSLIQPR